MMRCPDNLEQYRTTLAGQRGDESNGVLHWKPKGLSVQFSNGAGWEHVSVSRRSKCPSYEDMDLVKRAFWGAADVVMQLHVSADRHVNCHPYCLHLWRPIWKHEIPLPPAILVGPG
jgi:hypothetical protein